MSLFVIPALLFYYGLYFIVSLVISLSNFILKHFLGISQPDTKPVFGRIDLQKYIEEQTAGLMVEDEQDPEIQIFQNALDFSKVKARECMIPRNEIVALELNDNIEELKKTFIDSGYSRIIIFKENIDNIIGYVHSIEQFKIPVSIKSMLIPLSIVPESMSGIKLLEDFIDKKRSVSVVVDEYGGTSGILTMEDIIEEIFGEIDDEHDQEEFTHKIINENTFLFSARLEIDIINEKYRLKLPVKEDYETLSGMIISFAETIPENGAVFNIDNYQLKVLEVYETKISTVELKILEKD